MSKKKLAYLCLQATREGQAAHAHVHEIVAGLRLREWEVILFEPAYGMKTPSVLRRLIAFLSVQLRMIWSLRGVDITYVRWHFACFPAILALKALRIPVVLEVNGPYEDLFVAWPWMHRLAMLFRWLMRMQLKWADAVDDSLRALPAVLHVKSDVRVLMTGRGSLEASLRQLADKLELIPYLRWIGYVENSQLPQYLNAADLCVSSSLSDGTALSHLEAMACGLPVVLTDTPSSFEWVANGVNGFGGKTL